MKLTYYILTKFSLLILIMIFNSISAFSNEVSVTADSNSAFIGSRICISIRAKGDSKIIFPELADSLANTTIISKSLIDTIKSGNQFELSQKLYLSSFDSGTVVFPALTFFFADANGNLTPMYSNAINIKFSTPDISKMKNIYDIKPIINEDKVWTDYWYIYAIIISMLIIGLIIWRVSKNKKKSPIIQQDNKKEMPIINPDQWLRTELEELKANKYWQNGDYKKHFSILSDALRRYLELKFDFPAMESTTEDIEKRINSVVISEQSKFLINIFKTADLVKFAKYQPNDIACNNAIHQAEEFLNNIRR